LLVALASSHPVQYGQTISEADFKTTQKHVEEKNSLNSKSASELLYDWRFTPNQFVLATSPLRLTASNFIFQLNT
jgi:hypothetical protein